jgi:hypothetical protein
VLAEITPDHHTKTQTFLENQNLIRHWITSFQPLNMGRACAGSPGLSSHKRVTSKGGVSPLPFQAGS